MDAKTFTGDELLAVVESGELERNAAPIVGMVKKSGKPGCIAFSVGGCEDWIDLPVTLIDKAKRSDVGKRPCKDHFHSVVELTLKKNNDSTIQDLLLLVSKQQTVSDHARHTAIAQQINTGTIVPTAGNEFSRSMLASGYQQKVFNGCQLAHPYGTCEGGTVWYMQEVPSWSPTLSQRIGVPYATYGPYVALSPANQWTALFDIEMQGTLQNPVLAYQQVPLIIDAVYKGGSEFLSGPPQEYEPNPVVYGVRYTLTWDGFWGQNGHVGKIVRNTYKLIFDVPSDCNDLEIRTQISYAGISNVRIYSLTLINR